MSLPVSRIQKRAYVRTGANNLLMEGSGDSYGWVSNQIGPMRWGDFPTATPAWYLGRDDGGGAYPIGPNGPWVGQESILPAVTRATNVIVDTIVRTGWRYTDSNETVLPRPLWVDDPMGLGTLPGVLQPTVPTGLRLDGYRFFSTLLTHALWWGVGAFVCVENSAGEPIAGSLRLINPLLVGIDDDGHHVLDPNGEVPIRTGFDGRFIAGGKVWRLVVMRGLSPNDNRTPEGVLTRHFDTFRLGAAVSKYVAQTFTGMGVPAGLLKVSTPGFKKKDADDLKSDWMAAHGSSKRSVAVLNSTVEFQPISITPVDAGAEQMVHVARADVAHAFGLSSIWLDEGASGLTYQNNTDRRRDLVDISLSGWSESLMAVLSSLLPFGTSMSVNWASFTQPSVEAQLPALVQAVQAGILTATEARSHMGLVPSVGPDPNFHDNSPASKKPNPVPPALAQYTGMTDQPEPDQEEEITDESPSA